MDDNTAPSFSPHKKSKKQWPRYWLFITTSEPGGQPRGYSFDSRSCNSLAAQQVESAVKTIIAYDVKNDSDGDGLPTFLAWLFACHQASCLLDAEDKKRHELDAACAFQYMQLFHFEAFKAALKFLEDAHPIGVWERIEEQDWKSGNITGRLFYFSTKCPM